jgi:lipoic acid synthetase
VRVKKPKWLKVKLPTGEAYKAVRGITKSHNLHTICESGNCPNMGECWGAGTATFMILGNICTRSCGFCNVMTGRPLPVDVLEPKKVAVSVKLMNVKHAVITSVDRDDLKDGGSSIWVETINEIRKVNPGTTMETLIPDFKGRLKDIQPIIDVAPEVVSHNMETVRRLTKKVRIQARYERSLEALRHLHNGGIKTKSGIMLGLGETEAEVVDTMKDLRNVGVSIITIGQYLQPSKKHLPVVEFVTPEQFKKYKKIGISLGFQHVESSPLVRSSYHAEKHIH